MAKKKTQAPKNKKSELPLTKDEYNNAITVGGLVNMFKRFFEKNKDISEYHFVPMIHGYQILFNDKDKGCKVDIRKRKFFEGYKVTKYVDGFKKISCITKSRDDNEFVLEKLMVNPKAKKPKKG